MILGIDFGTCYSYVTMVRDGKVVEGAVKELNRGNESGIPTQYSCEGGKEACGSECEGKKVVREEFKSDIRRKPHVLDAIVEPTWPITYTDMIDGFIGYLIGLAKQSKFSDSIEYVCITAPVDLVKGGTQAVKYSSILKKAVMNCTGLDSDHVLVQMEPVAAAYGYLYENKDVAEGKSMKILVFDLGGGTVDVALAEYDGSQSIKVIDTEGAEIGGSEWTKSLVDYIEMEAEKQGISIVKNRSFARDVEEAKRLLSSRDETFIRIPSKTGPKVPLNVKEFESRTKLLLRECSGIVDKICERNSITADEIDRFVLVGGGSNMRQIQNYFRGLPGGAKKTIVYKPAEAISRGAGLYAYHYAHPVSNTGMVQGPDLISIAHHTYGVELFRDGDSAYTEVKNLIFKGDEFVSGRIYIQMNKSVRPQRDDQAAIEIRMFESDLLRSDCDSDGMVSIGLRTVPVGETIKFKVPSGYSKASDFRFSLSLTLFADGNISIVVNDINTKAKVLDRMVHSLEGDGDNGS